ncbi:YlzJ-like family protein [Paenibacillus sp. JX-17]|uniref:YlzJ-like family protein n=1 Tax=Paenibacillus lacisoli TaxID=3064525 RepID=A0ABT9CCR4_9BACL|nr:YlzJ-like family protein [Paenibacillus sp. JX-17]MDO7905772.1 YlzJ-like family protein [Paenibacillus sp. JX-17]
MTLYTTMPDEYIWQGMWKEPRPAQEIRYAGMLMEVRPVESDHRKLEIVRLLDCPLEAYLNPAWAPGQWIELGFNVK